MTELVTAAAFLLSINQKPHLAVHFTIAPKWHIYWENPGDSGLATAIETTGIDENLLYMGPEKIAAPGGLTNYGYHDQTVIFAAVDETYSLTTPIDISWLVCKADQCIRQQTTVKAQTASPEKNKHLKHLFEQLPKPLPADVSQTLTKSTFTLKWPGKTSLDVFPNETLEPLLTKVNITQNDQQTMLSLQLTENASGKGGGMIGVKTKNGTEYYLLSF